MRNSDGDRSPIQHENVDKHEANNLAINHEWVIAKTRGRWAPFWNGRTYEPPSSPARKKARARKYAWSHLTTPGDPTYVPLHLCMTGDELRAERPRIAGDGTSFREPRTDGARELVALLPHGRLRTVEAMLLCLLAYAMLQRRRHGLVATLGELGELVGLRTTAIGEAMARLIALGFVRADATYTRYGACESQRGNLWRLTTDAIAAFALRDVPEGIAVPAGTVDRTRLQRRRRCSVGSHAPVTPRNPEANPDTLCTQENNPESFRNGPRPAGAVVSRSATPTSKNFRTAVPDASAGRSQPVTRQGETRDASLRLRTEQVSRSAASVVEELAELVSDPVARAAILAAAATRKGGAS